MPVTLPEKLDAVEAELQSLKTQLAKLLDTRAFVIPVTTLEPAPFVLSRDIPVVLQPTGDDFVATFYDAAISATGDSEEEAVSHFKDMLVSKFNLLDRMPEERLGKGPRRQLAVLRTLIRRID